MSCRQWQRESGEADRVICPHLPACARARLLPLALPLAWWLGVWSIGDEAARMAGRQWLRCDVMGKGKVVVVVEEESSEDVESSQTTS